MAFKFTHGLLNFCENVYGSYWVCSEFTFERRFFQGENRDLGSQNCQLGATCTRTILRVTVACTWLTPSQRPSESGCACPTRKSTGSTTLNSDTTGMQDQQPGLVQLQHPQEQHGDGGGYGAGAAPGWNRFTQSFTNYKSNKNSLHIKKRSLSKPWKTFAQ